MLKTAHKILLARVASRAINTGRSALGLPAEDVFTRGGIRWRLDLREGIDFSIFLLGGFELQNLRAYSELIKPGNEVLDIGANIGAHTLPLARLVGPKGRVIAFEPTNFAAAKLRANIALNPDLAPRISFHQAMLVANTGAVPEPALFSSWPLVGGGDLHEKHKGRLMETHGARAVTLDQMMMELGVGKVDFVKLDVDGHELPVLQGSQAMLSRFRPIIAMELAPYIHAEFGYAFDELVALLKSCRYEFHSLSTRAMLPQTAQALRALVSDGAGINILAVPS